MKLTEAHIQYIHRDITYRGIVDEELGDELLDHICSLVEKRMEAGERFIEAYENVRKSFGSTRGLQDLQRRTISSTNSNFRIMFKNYFKIALRNLTRHKFYSVINIAGLAVSVACCMAIALFVQDELSYDRSFEDADRIYRMAREGKYGENEFDFPTGPAPLGPALTEEIPGVVQAVRFRNIGASLIKPKGSEESVKEEGILYSDPGVFQLFGIDMIQGDAATALESNGSAAVSRSFAQRHFQRTDVVGEVIVLDDRYEFNVTAVFEDLPENSHLDFDLLISMKDHERAQSTVWISNNNFFTYFKLREGASIGEVMQTVNALSEEKIAPEVEAYSGSTFQEFLDAGNYFTFYYQPLTDIYLNSDYTFDIASTGNYTYVKFFIIVALFILVLACINFMNLSTARSANRAREVGIRKVLGSFRAHLIRQFLMESTLISFISFILSIGILFTVLPFFNMIADKQLSVPLGDPLFSGLVILFSLVIGLLAGVYPAFFLSSFKPVNVLKGKLSLGSRSGIIRSGLVIFQFCISIILLVGTAVVYQQLSFIQNKQLGFNKDRVLMVNDTYMLGNSLEAFEEEVEALPFVESATLTGYLPINGYNRNDITLWKEGTEPTGDNLVNMQYWSVDEDYIPTLGLELAWGRNLDEELASDTASIVLNETAFRSYGFEYGEDNHIVTYAMNPRTMEVIMDEFIRYKVVGVVRDFHFESMTQEIGNVGMRLGRSSGILSMKINTDDYSGSIDRVSEVWDRFAPGLPFDYQFLDSAFDRMYAAEQRLATVFTLFAGLAIFIGCLGLFALASFMAEQRTREIGIRKVMGASVKSIVLMLSRDFSRLILLSFILATPLAWWAVNSWLENYEYRIDPGWEMFGLAGLVAFVIAWLTVGYQALKAALNDPVKSLRSE